MKKNQHPTSNIEHPTSNGWILSEVDELIRIFFSSIQTAKRNALAARRHSAGAAG